MMILFQQIEERNNKLKQTKPIFSLESSRPTTHYNASSTKNQAPTHFSPKLSLVVKPIRGLRGKSQFKNLTEVKIMENRAEGLCYRCDEKFVLGHRYKRRELQVLMVWDEEESGEPTKVADPKTTEMT